jgi:hypothetical protein
MRRPPPFFHRAYSTGPSHGDHSGCDMDDLQTSRILISVAVALPKVCIWMVKEGSSCRCRPNFAHARSRIRRSKDAAADFLFPRVVRELNVLPARLDFQSVVSSREARSRSARWRWLVLGDSMLSKHISNRCPSLNVSLEPFCPFLSCKWCCR